MECGIQSHELVWGMDPSLHPGSLSTAGQAKAMGVGHLLKAVTRSFLTHLPTSQPGMSMVAENILPMGTHMLFNMV